MCLRVRISLPALSLTCSDVPLPSCCGHSYPCSPSLVQGVAGKIFCFVFLVLYFPLHVTLLRRCRSRLNAACVIESARHRDMYPRTFCIFEGETTPHCARLGMSYSIRIRGAPMAIAFAAPAPVVASYTDVASLGEEGEVYIDEAALQRQRDKDMPVTALEYQEDAYSVAFSPSAEANQPAEGRSLSNARHQRAVSSAPPIDVVTYAAIPRRGSLDSSSAPRGSFSGAPVLAGSQRSLLPPTSSSSARVAHSYSAASWRPHRIELSDEGDREWAEIHRQRAEALEARQKQEDEQRQQALALEQQQLQRQQRRRPSASVSTALSVPHAHVSPSPSPQPRVSPSQQPRSLTPLPPLVLPNQHTAAAADAASAECIDIDQDEDENNIDPLDIDF
jgi:hypothetical protein